ncbi:MAG: PBP1A family penicillin-binding protein [Candidatus Hydrogenedentes bacterium]|nr:PBP1A family penicillin-binding protein [Candidatus Hydrogenedentota bacterium]
MNKEISTESVPEVKRRGCLGIFMTIMLVVAALWGIGLGWFVWLINDTRHNVSQVLADFRPKVGTRIYSSDGQLIGEFSMEERHLVRLNDIPLFVQKAFIATEDGLFYEHKGVRPDAILNSILYMVQTGKMRGGSTITQQVVRNVEDLQVGQERTYARKLREALVSLQVERDFTKDEILELYLNQVFLGISAYGVETGAQQYFGKHCYELSLSDAATLAGVSRWPNSNNPKNNPKIALSRRNTVWGQMLENKFITQAEYEEALQEDMLASVRRREPDSALIDYSVRGRFRAPYFVEEVRRFILSQYKSEQVFGDGLEVYTTVDMRLQEIAERVMLDALESFDMRFGKNRKDKDGNSMPVSGALVCIDNRPPYRGQVRAMVGGRDFLLEKYNTATQARRQPGSSVKPFVWAAGIASGMTPSTIVVDAPFSRRTPAGVWWTPKNFGGSFSGAVPIRYSLEKSINIVSVKIADQVGTSMVRSYLQRCGVPTDVEGLTIALGSGEVTPLTQCVAYSVFANGGMRYDPILVTDIQDADGIQRYNYRDFARSEQAMDPKVAYVLNSMLQGVCRTGGYYPTGWRAHVLERPVGGKTGTTNESRDAWFCGFTADYTTVVWVGYRDNRSLGSGADVTGGRLACPIWVDFMLEAEQDLPVEDFEVPPGIEFFSIDRRTGRRGGSYREAYIAGTAPPAYVPPPPPSPTNQEAGADAPAPPAPAQEAPPSGESDTIEG